MATAATTKTTKKTLVIVESPSKAKTIGKYLGARYKVIASVGHVRDLPKSKLGIDIEDDFEPQYIAIRGKGDIIKELRKEAKKASKVYLATDPDREGEAISWHLAFLLGLDPEAACRIEFNEITKNTIKEAIKVNGTYIVSAGDYGRYLGVVDLVKNSDGTVTLANYSLIAVDETVAEDPAIASKVAEFKQAVNNDYLAAYGMTFDQVLAHNKVEFEPQSAVGATQHESPLANLYADAYFWAAEKTLGFRPDIALTATGVIRESLPLGNITVSDVFNAASLGVGTEGELIAVYITGEDLWSALEVDASVQPIMPAAQLFFSGIEYSFNTNRMIFNKVDYARLRLADGTLAEIDDDKLYCVIAGMYAGQMLGSVKEKSFGLLSITPRNAEGKALSADELKDYVIRDENGRPLKEWYAISSYIENMGGEMDEAYATTDGRKVVYSSLNPIKLLRNPNIFTFVALILILLIILLIVLLVRFIIKRVKKRKAKKQIPEEKPEESNEG